MSYVLLKVEIWGLRSGEDVDTLRDSVHAVLKESLSPLSPTDLMVAIEEHTGDCACNHCSNQMRTHIS